MSPTHRLKAWLRPFYFTVRKLLSGQIPFAELAYFQAMYFSQFGEDIYLDQIFSGKATGFYVDVGAFHPFNISNTYVFYRKGWRGINIEPNPDSFKVLAKYRSRDINLNVAVGRFDSEVPFNCIEELSGVDDENHLFRDRLRGRARHRVHLTPLSTLLQKHLPEGTAIDFLTVDCEGYETEVLLSNDWRKYRPRIILVEDHGRRPDEIDAILCSLGYVFDRKLGLTKVFLDPAAAPSHSAAQNADISGVMDGR